MSFEASPHLESSEYGTIQLPSRESNALRRRSGESLHGFPSDDETTSTIVAGWNVTNIIQGIGIMGIPYACVCCGWFSIPVILVVAAYCCYTGELIAKCMYIKSYPNNDQSPDQKLLPHLRRKRRTFACIASDVWPSFGRTYTSIIVLLEVFGAMILYTILLGHSMTRISNWALNLNWSTAQWTVIYGYATMPLLMIPNMRIISYFSSVALGGLVSSIITTIVFCITKTITSQYHTTEIPGLPKVDLLSFPVGMSIILFSYCVHGVLPDIERSMKQPKQYNKMMRVSFSFAGLMKLVFGILPAYLFGSQVKQIITDNMVGSPGFVYVTDIGISINVFFSIPLVCFIVAEISNVAFFNFLDPYQFDIKESGVKWQSVTWLFLTRMVILSGAIFISVLVPQFALIMSLIGSITGSNLCFILPALMHMKLFKDELSKKHIAFHWFTIVFGFIVMILGVATSSYRLYTDY